MGIRNTPDQNRRASAKRRERLRSAGYRVLHTEIPGPLYERLQTTAREGKLTISAAVEAALETWTQHPTTHTTGEPT